MVVLGEKYKFTNNDLNRLNKLFKGINFIKYDNIEPNKTIQELKELLSKDNKKFFILNTKADVYSDLIKFIVSLKLNKTIHIYTIEQFLEKYLYKTYIPDNFVNLEHLKDLKEYNAFQYIQKRVIDYALSMLILTAIPIVKIITKKKMQKESPGEVYFKQKRVGKNSIEFDCIKFRTMQEHNCENRVETAIKDDDRVYPWGKFLRKSRLDEIPQVFNVLKGQMHIIGPRAEWNKLVEEYEQDVPYYNLRHIVAPGITGWAQVMFVEGKAKEDTKQKLMYDLYYIKNWSLWLELKTIYKTILVVLGRKGI